MLNTGKLAGKTLFITGASRGIGAAIALKAAKDGANIIIAAKTGSPHPKLPGTIYTVAEEVEKNGGKCLPCIVDIRFEEQVKNAVESAVSKFGGIDAVVNNASAISLTGTLDTTMKKYDLMHSINGRGTFLISNPHILTISPPLNLNSKWFKDHVAYTMSKYVMSMCVLGMAEEFKDQKVAVNALWPETAIFTAAMEMLSGGKEIASKCRYPSIMADAAYSILCQNSSSFTGNFTTDEIVLQNEGITNFDQYAVNPNDDLLPDAFLDRQSTVKSESIFVSVLKHTDERNSQHNGIVSTEKQKSNDSSRLSASQICAEQPEAYKIFEHIQGYINPEVIEKANAVFLFKLNEGKKESTWHLDLKNGTAGHGELKEKADVIVTMELSTFLNMFKGTLSPIIAYMTGRMKIKGDVNTARKLDRLLPYFSKSYR